MENGAVKKWVKKGNPPPLFFDENHIGTSLDVFPMEFLDMQSNRTLVFGIDPLSEVTIKKQNLRHQCESELKGKLINLRTYYVANCDKPKLIANIMIESFSAFMAVFRGILRLKGEDGNPKPADLIERISQITEINPQVFLDLLDIKKGNSVLPRGNETLEMFEQYLTELSAITNYVDNWS